jgi:hypothetical protein
VPCSFRERLDKFAKKWLVARSPRYRSFDLFLMKDDAASRTTMCGPYWTSLIRVYNIGIGDVLYFEYNDDPLEKLDNMFDVTVYSNGVEKEVVEDTGMSFLQLVFVFLLVLFYNCCRIISNHYSSLTVVSDLPSSIRSILYRTIFSDIQSITEQDMAAILFGIYKDVYLEHEFYEPMDQKNFWVHKMNEENMELEALVSFHVITHCSFSG